MPPGYKSSMSSIRQQHEPVMKSSPIPRSRSDFGYVGLSPREKRWTTDFSLLLPPFPRDNSGYSRLAESPVTHQPRHQDNRTAQDSPTPKEDGTKTTTKPHSCINRTSQPSSISEGTATLHTSTPTSEDRTLNKNQACSRSYTSGIKPSEVEPHSIIPTSESKTPCRNQAQEPQASRHFPTREGVIPTTTLHQIPQQHRTPLRSTSEGFEARTLGRSQTLELHTTRHIAPISEGVEPRTIGRSQTAELVTSQSINFNETKRTKPAIRKSPTLEPYNPKCNSASGSKKLYPTVELSSMGGSLAITRIVNPTTHPLANEVPHHSTLEGGRCKRTNPFTSESARSEAVHHPNCRSSTPEGGSRHLRCHSVSPEASRLASSRHLTPEASRHLVSTIRRSPTLGTLRYSPLLSHQHVISRSPTLDPGALSRGPPRCGGFRSPVAARVTASPAVQVVRSQSMRSLRRDRSPAKVRNSESAQTDITCAIHRGVVEADEYDDFRRLRNFSVTTKGGVINWGDSFRSHSLTSSCSQWDVASTKSYPMTTSQWTTCTHRTPHRYRVAIVGADEVGKTSLIRQFQTSEYICAFDTSYDLNKECEAITVILNKEESELEFIEHRLPDEGCEESVPWADAYVVVYSVTSRRSFSRACELLATKRSSAMLLVGNKSDLVRVRAVTTDDGESAARDQGSPFIETSAAINHQVDELLVAILTHIRATTASASSRWRHSSSSLSRAKGLIKKFLKKACFHSKSADSLQRL